MPRLGIASAVLLLLASTPTCADGLKIVPDTLPASVSGPLARDLGKAKLFLLSGQPKAHTAAIGDTSALVPLGLFAAAPLILVARPDFTTNDGAEAIAELRKRGSQTRIVQEAEGSASQVCAKALQAHLSVTMAIVGAPAGQAVAQLKAGAADVACMDAPSALPLLKAGDLVGLAVAGEERLASLWDVPTGVEVGLPLFMETTWFGLYAPGDAVATHAPAHSALQSYLASDANVQAMIEAGLSPFPLTHRAPDAHAAFLSARSE